MFPSVLVALVVAALAILFVVRQRARHRRGAGARRGSKPRQQARRIVADKAPATRSEAVKPAQNRAAPVETRTAPAKPVTEPRRASNSTMPERRPVPAPTRPLHVPSASAAAIVRTLRGESSAARLPRVATPFAKPAPTSPRVEPPPPPIPVRRSSTPATTTERVAPAADRIPTVQSSVAPLSTSSTATAIETVALRASIEDVPVEDWRAIAARASASELAPSGASTVPAQNASSPAPLVSDRAEPAIASAPFEPSASATHEKPSPESTPARAPADPLPLPQQLVASALPRASNDDIGLAPVAPTPAANANPARVAAAVEPHKPEVVQEAPPARAKVRVDLPPLDLLSIASEVVDVASPETLDETSRVIEQRLREFKVPVTVLGASAGPVITRFEVEPAVGVRGNQIVALMKDLARGLGRTSIRVVETIPGKTCMGLELPNEKRQMIGLADILRSPAYRRQDSPLTLAMGKDITGEPIVTDLSRAPHMLVAGTTGSGKSVAVNAMILSMLYKATPDEVRLILIDPKMLELSVYEGIPHLLAPVVTDMKLAANALNWCVVEMEDRYRLMSELRVRNLAGYNAKIRAARAAGAPLRNPVSKNLDAPELLDTLPMIVVVIDELADLMMVAGKKIEELIARLAQKARAAGIHLILATQRPSVDVITGLIKANIPTRVAFQVSSKIDSRTILDQMGAESLLGQGDMLFLPPGTGYPQRVHGAFVGDEEVHRIVAWLKQFGEPDYRADILAGPALEAASDDLFGEPEDAEADPLYDEAVAFVVRSRRASISSVQRQFRIGYNRAARLVESMEAAGLVSALGRNGVREVLAPGGVSDEL